MSRWLRQGPGLYPLPLASVVACALAACPSTRVTTVEHDVSVQPAVLDFGEVPVTGRHAERVTITNRARGAELLSPAVPAPFLLTEQLLGLAGGAELELQVTFAPRAAGAVLERLVVFPGVEVELHGVGVEPSACQTPWSCWSSSIVDGVCVTEPRPDGTACSAPCLEAASCRAGQCLGSPKVCANDADACTIESCDAQLGCMRARRVCPAPTDPCKSSFCDPVGGCLEAAVDDGTACGPQRCEAAQVCITGACVTRPLPEGGLCQAAGVCHGEGRCRAAVCEATARPLVLEPHALLSGFVEGRGQLWGTWYTSPQFSLNSLELPDLPRFATPLASGMTGGSFAVPVALLHHEGVIYAGKLGLPALTAFEAQTGAMLWSQSQSPAFAFGFVQLAVSGDGAALVSRTSRLSALSPSSGQPVWSVATRGPQFGEHPLAGTAAGGAVLLERQEDGGTLLRRFGVQGNELPPVVAGVPGTLAAVAQGQAWLISDHTLERCPFDGGGCEDFPTGSVRTVFESRAGVMHWLSATPAAGADGGVAVELAHPGARVPLSLGHPSVLKALPLADGRTLILTWTFDESRENGALFVLDPRDAVIEECPLRNDGNLDALLLTTERLVSSDGAWVLPGVVPLDGTQFWVGRARNNQAWSLEAAY